MDTHLLTLAPVVERSMATVSLPLVKFCAHYPDCLSPGWWVACLTCWDQVPWQAGRWLWNMDPSSDCMLHTEVMIDLHWRVSFESHPQWEHGGGGISCGLDHRFTVALEFIWDAAQTWNSKYTFGATKVRGKPLGREPVQARENGDVALTLCCRVISFLPIGHTAGFCLDKTLHVHGQYYYSSCILHLFSF